MSIINNKVRILVIVALGLMMQSCLVSLPYQRPDLSSVDPTADSSQTASDTSKLPSPHDFFTDAKLKTLIEIGLKSNLDLLSTIEQLKASEAYLAQARSGYLPTLSAYAQGGTTNPSLKGANGIGKSERSWISSHELGLNLSWELDIWGKVHNQKKAAQAQYLKSVNAKRFAESQLVAAIAGYYYNLLALDLQVEILTQALANRQASLETIKALKIAGTVTEVAVLQTEAQMHSVQVMLVESQNAITIQEHALCVLLSIPMGKIDRLTLAEQSKSKLNTDWPIALLRHRPDVMASENELMYAFAMTNVARAGFYPNISIGISGGLNSLNFENLFSADALFASILGSLTQPILNGRAVRTQYKASQYQKEAALLQFKSTVLIAQSEVADAKIQLSTLEEISQIKQKESVALESAATFSEELLKQGMANYLEVLMAKDNALSAKLSLAQIELKKLNAATQLYKAVGGGWSE